MDEWGLCCVNSRCKKHDPTEPTDPTHRISPATMFSNSWSWDGSAKGVRPVRNSKQRTPRDHQSTASSCPMARMISGARYCLLCDVDGH